jgi:hypothetical protein
MAALQSYVAETMASVASCNPPVAFPNDCPGTIITCPSGQCELHHPTTVTDDAGVTTSTFSSSISAADYPNTCATVDDCVSVYQGALGCCGTPCPNTTISASAEARYKAELLGRTPFCNPPPPCLPLGGTMCPGRVDCQNGQCVLLGATP